MSEKLMRGDPVSFYTQMRKRCINKNDFSDITFLIGPKREPVHAHRAMLAARSEVFRTVLKQQLVNGNNKQGPLVLEDEKPEVFLTMLDYMYTNCCTLTIDLCPDVLSNSIEYGLDGLRKIACRFMADCLSIESAAVIFQSAILHDQKELKKRSLAFIEENTLKVFDSERFNDLSDTAFAALLRSDLLQLDEIDILDRVKKWAKTNSISSGQSLRKIAAPVIYTVRLALLSPEELADIEKENDETHFIPVDMLAQAWKMHALKSKGTDKGSIRLRRGTKPRDIHNFIALAANRNPSSDSESGGDETGRKILEASKLKETSSDS